MVTETSAAETPPERDEAQSQAATSASVLVWIVYALGIVAAIVLAASLVFVGAAWATSGGGQFGIDVAVPALVVWMVLIGLAAGTFAVRRWGRPQ